MPIRIKPARGSKDIYQQNRRKRIIAACAASSLLLILGGLILVSITILIKIESDNVLISYTEDVEVQEIKEPVKDISGNPSPVAPPINIAVSTSVSDVTMEAVDFDMEGVIGGTGNMPGGGLGGDGLGPGSGAGTGTGMGGKEKADSAFVGQFWDLKKLKNRSDSPLKTGFASNQETLNLISQFFNNKWQQGAFDRYFKSPVKLYAQSFYMPFCLDSEASNAYDPTKKMGLKASRWVAIYTAKVQAPKSGRFRFVGLGDSVLAVRFNGQNVLATGMHTLENAKFFGAGDEGYRKGKDFYEYASCQAWNSEAEGGENALFGFMGGEEFTVKKDEWYEMEVLVSEIGGGYFGFCLLIDDLDDPKKAMSADGKPLFQLFRTALVSPTAEEAYAAMIAPPDKAEGTVDPPYDADSYVWRAK